MHQTLRSNGSRPGKQLSIRTLLDPAAQFRRRSEGIVSRPQTELCLRDGRWFFTLQLAWQRAFVLLAMMGVWLNYLPADAALRARDTRTCLVSLGQRSYYVRSFMGAQGALTCQIVGLNTATSCAFVLMTVHAVLANIAPLHLV